MDHTLAQAIADKLGWKFISNGNYKITSPEGVTILLYGNTASYERISYVDAIGERVTYPSDHNVKHLSLSINFTLGKGADKIAKDILNRLCPNAKEAHQRGLEEKNRHDSYAQQIRDNQASILSCHTALLDIKSKSNLNGEPQFTLLRVGYDNMKNGYGDIQIHSNVNLNLQSVPVGAAIAMLTAWNDWIKKTPKSEE